MQLFKKTLPLLLLSLSLVLTLCFASCKKEEEGTPTETPVTEGEGGGTEGGGTEGGETVFTPDLSLGLNATKTGGIERDAKNNGYYLLSDGSYAFAEASSTAFDGIPLTFKDKQVSVIDGAAFSGVSVTSVTIPAGVTVIENYAFQECRTLETITIPANVKRIGASAFEYCTALTTVTFAEGSPVTELGIYAFNNCRSLTSIALPTGLTAISEGTFTNCTSLPSIALPASVTEIGEQAFYECTALSSVTMGNAVKTIDDEAFYNCTALWGITLSTALETIGENAFRDSGLRSLTVPVGVKKIEVDGLRADRLDEFGGITFETLTGWAANGEAFAFTGDPLFDAMLVLQGNFAYNEVDYTGHVGKELTRS